MEYTYRFDDYRVEFALPIGEPDAPIWRLECYPRRLADFDQLTDHLMSFMPSDSVLLGNEELEMTEANVQGLYYSEIIEDEYSGYMWHDPDGVIQVLYFRDDEEPSRFEYASLQLSLAPLV